MPIQFPNLPPPRPLPSYLDSYLQRRELDKKAEQETYNRSMDAAKIKAGAEQEQYARGQDAARIKLAAEQETYRRKQATDAAAITTSDRNSALLKELAQIGRNAQDTGQDSTKAVRDHMETLNSGWIAAKEKETGQPFTFDMSRADAILGPRAAKPGFSLAPGAKRFDAEGEFVAGNPAAASTPGSLEKEARFIAEGMGITDPKKIAELAMLLKSRGGTGQEITTGAQTQAQKDYMSAVIAQDQMEEAVKTIEAAPDSAFGLLGKTREDLGGYAGQLGWTSAETFLASDALRDVRDMVRLTEGRLLPVLTGDDRFTDEDVDRARDAFKVLINPGSKRAALSAYKTLVKMNQMVVDELGEFGGMTDQELSEFKW